MPPASPALTAASTEIFPGVETETEPTEKSEMQVLRELGWTGSVGKDVYTVYTYTIRNTIVSKVPIIRVFVCGFDK